MKPCLPPDRVLSFTCLECHTFEEFKAIHCTLAYDGERLLLLAKCATEGTTARADVAANILDVILRMPILVDPDAVEHLTRKASL